MVCAEAGAAEGDGTDFFGMRIVFVSPPSSSGGGTGATVDGVFGVSLRVCAEADAADGAAAVSAGDETAEAGFGASLIV